MKKRYGGIDRYLLNENGWQMASWQLLGQMGLSPTGPIPKDLEMSQFVTGTDGHPVEIRVRRSSGRVGRRVFAVCPECDREVCAGHLHQHVQGSHA